MRVRSLYPSRQLRKAKKKLSRPEVTQLAPRVPVIAQGASSVIQTLPTSISDYPTFKELEYLMELAPVKEYVNAALERAREA